MPTIVDVADKNSTLMNALWAPLPHQRYELRAEWMFEKESWKTWVDIYGAFVGSPTLSTNSWNLAPPAGGDIDYLGRCNVPFRRIYEAVDLKKAFASQQQALSGRTSTPNSTAVIIRQRHSRSRLQTSRELFECVLDSCILGKESCLDHVVSYGFRLSETDIGGPQLWYKPCFNLPLSRGVSNPQLYECGYTLKYVERSRASGNHEPWSERQTTIFRSNISNSWILISPSESMQVALDEHMKIQGIDGDGKDFALHLSFVEVTLANWRPYLSWLTHEANTAETRTIVTDPDDPSFNILTVGDRQGLRLIEDRIADMFAMLDSTLDILTSLQEKYNLFFLDADTSAISPPLHTIRTDPTAFGMHESIRFLHLQRRQLESLQSRVASCVTLLSSLLDLENGHSLRALAEESRAEGVVMAELNRKAVSDGSAVKVITIITLIYLPISVVVSFFSTQLVNVVHGGGGRGANNGHISVVENWWIFLAIGVPLTLVTLGFWWLLCQRKNNGMRTHARVLPDDNSEEEKSAMRKRVVVVPRYLNLSEKWMKRLSSLMRLWPQLKTGNDTSGL